MTTESKEPKRVSDLAYAATVAKSVVANVSNILKTTTVKRTLRTAYNVARTTSWKKHVEYPVMVAIETTNKCNATCWFCPITEGSKRPPSDPAQLIQLGKKSEPAPEPQADPDAASFNLMKRELGYMSDELFEKIIDDCKRFPLRRLEPYLHGEPFMDRKICERIEYINKHLPQTEVHIFTNGSLLTKKTVDKLKELNIASMVISLNTAVGDKYNAIMGLDWKKTLANLERVAAENRTDKKVADRFVMRMTAPKETTDAEIAAFRKLAKQMGARAVIVSLHNYKGDITSERPVPQFPCYFVNDLDILYDGRTALCCMDHDGDYSWGDVSKHSVLEVYNSKEAKHYRTMMREDRRNELTPCNECNMFWWSLERTGVRRLQYSGRIAQYLIKHRPLRF
ncbi:MAG TPA: radical SAM/SPASM domain-containing protein [Kofleriaceae bacterium]|nr:radical SAM/SPASM domain-containing protein [Kofleriaceae bacterium]